MVSETSLRPFVGREDELESLKSLFKKKTASLVVIKGRRRIGKSRLIEEFGKSHKRMTYLCFTGLPPTHGTTSASQQQEFAQQLSQQLKLPRLDVRDWSELFTLLANQTQKGRSIILLDEISWMGSKDPDFLGKLKIAWDLYFEKNPKLILVLCGSISSWIEENILRSTGFFGRISLTLTLKELSLPHCHTLMDQLMIKRSMMEEFMILSITGGIPWYIELFSSGFPVMENMRRLCYEPEGQLVMEFEHIFHDLFGRRSDIYRKIVLFLSQGPASYNDIAEHVTYTSGGPLSNYLDDLVSAGFLSRDFTWSFQKKISSRLSHYRLKDNYLRFYLKYILPNKTKIDKGQFKGISVGTLPNWETIVGLQFENLILANRDLILKKLKVHPQEIVCDNPYFQRKTATQNGCQIDYLVETKFNTLYVCEIKFSRNAIPVSIIDEVQEKINKLKRPKGFSCRPVLIHVNGVQDSVIESGFFETIIEFQELL